MNAWVKTKTKTLLLNKKILKFQFKYQEYFKQRVMLLAMLHTVMNVHHMLTHHRSCSHK